MGKGLKKMASWPWSLRWSCRYDHFPESCCWWCKKLVKMCESDDESERWCAVCNDISSGYHYGANTCEGCKSFFKRTVQKDLHEKYKCSGKDDCPVDRKSRAKCPSCRLNKCFAVGMVLEGISSCHILWKKYYHIHYVHSVGVVWGWQRKKLKITNNHRLNKLIKQY